MARGKTYKKTPREIGSKRRRAGEDVVRHLNAVAKSVTRKRKKEALHKMKKRMKDWGRRVHLTRWCQPEGQ